MFENYRAYQNFSNKIRNSDRFALSQENLDFVQVFKDSIHSRAETLKKDTKLVRAARAYDEYETENGSTNITGASEDRMLPKREFAFEGRVNPSGTVVLYLASSKATAVSEVRPWVGEVISIALFSIVRDLKIANLSKGHNQSLYSGLSLEELSDPLKIPIEKANKCVWNDIDSAFSQPTTRTDIGAEYTPTQFLSEVVKNEGFDGIFYKSAFGGEQGYNIALFDSKDAQIISCNAFGIDGIEVEFSQAGNAWSKKT